MSNKPSYEELEHRVQSLGKDYEKLKRKEEELNLILNLVPGIVCTAGIDGYFKSINPAMEKTLGFSKEELLSRPLFDFIHPDDHTPVKTEIEEKVGGRRIRYFENRYLCKDGTYRWLEWHTTSAVDGILYATARDITARKQAQEALQASEAELAAIFENSAAGITVSDLNGHVLRTNPAHKKMFGYSTDELSMMSFSDFTHPDDVGKHLGPYKEMLAGKHDHFSIQKRFVHKKGHVIWARVTISLVRDDNNQPLFVVGILEDVTERKQAEEEKEQLIVELRNALKEVKTLQGIVPICMYCKQIRDDQGFWNRVEAYIEAHTEAEFSHGICPECGKKHYPEIYERVIANKKSS